MSYDIDLAERIRTHLAATAELSERAMFGGLAFLVDGHMAVAANRDGGLMVRVGPGDAESLLASTPARPVEMRGRQMRGWLHLDLEHVADEATLAEWIEIGLTHVATLPAKASGAP